MCGVCVGGGVVRACVCGGGYAWCVCVRWACMSLNVVCPAEKQNLRLPSPPHPYIGYVDQRETLRRALSYGTYIHEGGVHACLTL